MTLLELTLTVGQRTEPQWNEEQERYKITDAWISPDSWIVRNVMLL